MSFKLPFPTLTCRTLALCALWILLESSARAATAAVNSDCLASGSLGGQVWDEAVHAPSDYYWRLGIGSAGVVRGSAVHRATRRSSAIVSWASLDAHARRAEASGPAMGPPSQTELALFFLVGGLAICWLAPEPRSETLTRYGR